MQDVCFRDRYSRNLFADVPTVRRAPDILFSYPMPRVAAVEKQIQIVLVEMGVALTDLVEMTILNI